MADIITEAQRARRHEGAYSVECPHCGSEAGIRCGTISDWCRKPHKARVVLAAFSDPVLAAFFPAVTNLCQICGWLPQRHRIVSAIAGHLAAGETEQDVMDELEVSLDAVMAVTAWMNRYPGAWK